MYLGRGGGGRTSLALLDRYRLLILAMSLPPDGMLDRPSLVKFLSLISDLRSRKREETLTVGAPSISSIIKQFGFFPEFNTDCI
jgi:hypothetical protein